MPTLFYLAGRTLMSGPIVRSTLKISMIFGALVHKYLRSYVLSKLAKALHFDVSYTPGAARRDDHGGTFRTQIEYFHPTCIIPAATP